MGDSTQHDPATLIDLSGKTALVTGAGKGIGRACAVLLAQAGAHVLAVARTAADLESLARKTDAIEPWQADVTDEGFYAALEALPRLDILVNNAGGNRREPFLEVSPENLDFVLGLNLRAAFRTAQSAARVMAPAKRGSIVNTSSQLGHIAMADRSVYTMTKFGIEGLTKAMALELAPLGIRVNAVAPTYIDTPLTRASLEDPDFRQEILDGIPLGRIGKPEEIAAAVLYLASPQSTLVTGHSLLVDGGWTAR